MAALAMLASLWTMETLRVNCWIKKTRKKNHFNLKKLKIQDECM